MLRKIFIIGLLYYLGLFSGCSTRVVVQRNQSNLPENPFSLNPASPELAQNSALREKLQGSVYNYFRFINIPFSRVVCQDFKKIMNQLPLVNLHGDAHLEQYAITDSGRGLTDFDDASIGPPLLDWLRFSVSIRLACQILDREAEADSLIQIFFNGYAMALRDGNFKAPEPAFIKSIRNEFKFEPESYFTWIRKLMIPIRRTEQDSLQKAMTDYISFQYKQDPGLPPDYFEIIQCGALQMGVGSALDQKYLLQVQGETSDLADDVILELKEVRNLVEIDCIQKQPSLNPLRVLLAESRIAYTPFVHLGYFKFREKYFWVHAWGRHYQEVKITQSFMSFNELAELVFDVGIQLGKGHPKFIAAPFEDLFRQELLQILKLYRPDIKITSEKYAIQISNAWNQFKTINSQK